MAIQFHVAHSSKITGLGIFAAPPFYCAAVRLSHTPPFSGAASVASGAVGPTGRALTLTKLYTALPHCPQGNVGVALSSCMKDPATISMDALYTATAYAATTDTIDDPSVR